MKLKYYGLIIIIICTSSSLLFSQNIKIGIGGGYAYIDNDTYYTRDVKSSYFSSQLGLRNCYVINSKIKYSSSEIPIILTGEISFFLAKNNVDYLGYYSFIQSSPAKMHLDVSQYIYSIGIGIESPIVTSFITPYLSLSILLNYFGKTKVERTPKPDSMFDDPKNIISNSLRAGINMGFGFDFTLSEKISVDLATKYSFMNLVGKKNVSQKVKEENFNTISIVANVFYNF